MKEKISLLKRVSIVDDARSILRDMVIPPELLKEKTNGGRITSVCEKSKEGGTAYLEVMGVIEHWILWLPVSNGRSCFPPSRN